MEDLQKLQSQRKIVKGNVTRIKNLLSDSMSTAELECRLSLIEAYFKQLLKVQTDIEILSEKDSGRAEIEELCITAKSKAIELLGDNYKRSQGETSVCIPVTASSKLPKLMLPTFSGKYSEFKNFAASFRQLVESDSSLSNIEKFNHLLQCLSGQALDTVRAFQVTTENYQKALTRLHERYDNRTLIFLEHISDLYRLQEVQKVSATSLRHLVDSASAIYSSLKSLGDDKDICNSLIIYLILQKTDIDTQIKWKEGLDFSKLPTWEDFSKHLERRCQFLESTDSNNACSDLARAKKQGTNRQQYNRSSFHTRVQSKSCSSCKSADHFLSGCQKFKGMDALARFDEVKRLGLCLNCLSEGHSVAKCTSKYKCKICGKSHNTLLHRSSPINDKNTPISTDVTPVNSASVHAHVEDASNRVILATAIVLIRDSVGHFKLGRALLDSCSQVNLISEHFANILTLPKKKTSVQILGVGCSASKLKYETLTSIRSRFNEIELSLNLLIANRLSGYQPESELDISSWQLPSNIELADEHFHQSKAIDLLLGAECFFEILRSGQMKLGQNLPTLQETSLGWIVSGRYKSSNISSKEIYFLANTDEGDEDLNTKLEYLWALQDVTTSRKEWSEEEQSCENSYKAQTTTNSDGRIVVKLPFKESPSALGSSYHIALRRFNSLERCLARDGNLKQQYVQFMREYEQLGHMTKIKKPNFSEPHYFIPHQCVLRPNSTTTKLRVVFDASANTSTQISLNDILQVGPTIQAEMYMHILRFRLYKFALTGDIKKMYRMVLVHHTHRQFQQILWRESQDAPINTYQLNTITYDKWHEKFEKASYVLKNHFYVDDLLTGANNIDDLQQIKLDIILLLQKGGFELAKIQSNHILLRTDDPSLKSINLDDRVITNALGIAWDPEIDQFLFSYNSKKTYTVFTKRSILSLSSSIFDPIGLIAPIIIKPRVLLQDLWLMKIHWDTEVPKQIRESFQTLLVDLQNLHLIKILRYVMGTPTNSIQLHGFSDASIRAYGSCIYVRVCDEQGHVFVNLLTAKCRVAPVKKRTLPQLELCGAHLLAQLYQKVLPLFDNFELSVYLWTDSSVVLHWLQ